MKLVPQKFVLENFKSQSSWISPLLSSLNSFLNDLVFASTNNFTVADNLYQEIKELKFTNAATNKPLRFKTKFNANPKGLLVIYVFNNTLGAYATQFPVIEWSYSNGEVIISELSGLTASSVYTIRILAIYG